MRIEISSVTLYWTEDLCQAVAKVKSLSSSKKLQFRVAVETRHIGIWNDGASDRSQYAEIMSLELLRQTLCEMNEEIPVEPFFNISRLGRLDIIPSKQAKTETPATSK